jgi:hypothetical protein
MDKAKEHGLATETASTSNAILTKANQSKNSSKSEIYSSDNLERNVKLLAKFISQLVESQREFSEQLGLSYARVFTDDYEDFKGKNIVEVIRTWLASGPKEQVKLARLLADISKHQMALIAATDGVVKFTVEQLEGQSSTVFNKKFKNYCQEIKENPHKRFNELVAPGLSTSYIKQREIQKSIK